MKAYLANGLFGLGDRMLNELLGKEIREALRGLDLYIPQENGDINDKSAYADSQTIARADIDKLMESDFLVAVIDGVEIDSGVAAEIGAFYMMNKPIYALYSDIRQQGRDVAKKIDALIEDGTENQFVYRNLFVIGLIKDRDGGVFSNIDDLVKKIKDDLSF